MREGTRENAADRKMDVGCHGNTRGAKTALGEKITGGSEHGQACGRKLLVSATGIRRNEYQIAKGYGEKFSVNY